MRRKTYKQSVSIAYSLGDLLGISVKRLDEDHWIIKTDRVNESFMLMIPLDGEKLMHIKIERENGNTEDLQGMSADVPSQS